MKTTSVIMSMIVLTAGCMSGKPPGSDAWQMTSPLISLNASQTQHKKELGATSGTFCTGDADLMERKGYVNETTRSASADSGASLIKNASFTSNESGCVTLSGTAAR